MVIPGLESFRKFFKDYTDSFALIGGVATAQWLEAEGFTPRATKDFDLVLIIENLDNRAIERFWEYIKAGNYSHKQKSSGNKIFYRFTDPQEADFPVMLELFSRKPDGITLWQDQTIVPIPVDEEIASLSAILMDEAYYALVREHRQVLEDLPLLSPPCLILLKARAWLDLTEQRRSGKSLDERNIKKHRGDVFKLAMLLTPGEHIVVPASVREDLLQFLSHFPADSQEWGNILQSLGKGHQTLAPSVLIETLVNYFSVAEEEKDATGAPK